MDGRNVGELTSAGYSRKLRPRDRDGLRARDADRRRRLDATRSLAARATQVDIAGERCHAVDRRAAHVATGCGLTRRFARHCPSDVPHRFTTPPRRGRTPSKPGAATAQVQSLTRGLSILEALAQGRGRPHADRHRAARRSCRRRPTHRLLATLEKMGYVYQAGELGLWYVGLQAFTVGSSFLANRDFVAQSHPYMRRLMEQSGETANLGDPRRHRGGVHRPGAVPRDDAHDRQARQPRAAARVGRGQGDLRRAARRADRRDPQGQGPAAHHRATRSPSPETMWASAARDPPARLVVRRRGARARHALRGGADLRRARGAARRDFARRDRRRGCPTSGSSSSGRSSRTPPRS